MEIKTEILLKELATSTEMVIAQVVGSLKNKSFASLTWKESQTSWSILECLEHLNLYGDFYNPEIKRVIENASTHSEITFKSGVLGNYFAESILPKKNLKKMKTFKDKNPIHCTTSGDAIEVFLRQQQDFLGLIDRAKKVNLTKEKTKITLTNFIKLRLGDTFRFIVNHNLRHLKQIENIEKKQSEL